MPLPSVALPSVSGHQRGEAGADGANGTQEQKSHPQHALSNETEGRRAESRRKLRKAHGGGAQPPPALSEHCPTALTPVGGRALPPAPASLADDFRGLAPDPMQTHLAQNLSKKRSAFSKHGEKHKVRNCELSRSDVSSHGEETGPQSGRMTNPTA